MIRGVYEYMFYLNNMTDIHNVTVFFSFSIDRLYGEYTYTF
jgi:hypothetical protein